MNKTLNTKKLVTISLMLALTTVMTMVIQIPIVGANGYVNVGDTVILFSGIYLGKKGGALAGGIGSALADMFLGYAMFAPITLIVKGLEGFICGFIASRIKNIYGRIIACLIAGLVMVLGYFIGEIFLFDLKIAAVSIIPNLIQATFSIVFALLLSGAFDKIFSKKSIF